MKYLICIFSIFLVQPVYAQQLEIISMDHFGGDRSDIPVYPGIIAYPNGSVALTIATFSTTGDILTGCPALGVGRRGVFRYYNNDFSTMLGQQCAPVGADFLWPSFFVYPQPNGDTIIVSQSMTAAQDLAIERRDPAGTLIWSKHYGGTGNDGLGQVALTQDGGFYLTAATNSTDGDVGLHYGSFLDADMWVLRLDHNGEKLWSKVIGGSGVDLVRSIKLAPDGGCYLFGVTSSDDYDATGMKGATDLYIVKLDSSGNKQWHRCLGGCGGDGGGYEEDIFVEEDGQGGFYILNQAGSQDGDVQQRMADEADLWLVHVDSLANILWENTFGGPGWQVPSGLCRAADGSLWLGATILNGSQTSPHIDERYGRDDCWVVHTDSQGQFINQRVLGTSSDEYIRGMHAVADGTVIAVGHYRKNTPSGPNSPGFPKTTNSTDNGTDVFLAHLGPQTVNVTGKTIPFDDWDISPNPASKEIRIDIKKSNQTYEVAIADAQGKIIFKNKFQKQLTINVENWVPGIYFVILIDKEGKSVHRKLTIQA